MEWRDGKLHIGYEDQAEFMRDLAEFGQDGGTRAELRRVGRELDAKAADPTHPTPVVRHMVIGGRAWLRSDSVLSRLLRGGH